LHVRIRWTTCPLSYSCRFDLLCSFAFPFLSENGLVSWKRGSFFSRITEMPSPPGQAVNSTLALLVVVAVVVGVSVGLSNPNHVRDPLLPSSSSAAFSSSAGFSSSSEAFSSSSDETTGAASSTGGS
jgi:hypothetical protein